MVDEQNAREQIADVAAWCLYDNEHKTMFDPATVATDRIIAIVREALLSEPAVDAAMAVIEYRRLPPVTSLDWEDWKEVCAAQEWEEERDDWHEAFSAAWDSVMGEGSEDSNES